jgi:hypothetical protein
LQFGVHQRAPQDGWVVVVIHPDEKSVCH